MSKRSSPVANSKIKYGGFWIRLAASLIDTILLAAIILPILLAVYGKEYFSSDDFIQGPIDFLLTWVLPIAAIITFWLAQSATPGKMLFTLKIVDAETFQKPTTLRFIIRYLGYYLAALPFFLGFFWIAFDKRKQGWHDKLAGTVVIYEKSFKAH